MRGIKCLMYICYSWRFWLTRFCFLSNVRLNTRFCHQGLTGFYKQVFSGKPTKKNPQCLIISFVIFKLFIRLICFLPLNCTTAIYEQFSLCTYMMIRLNLRDLIAGRKISLDSLVKTIINWAKTQHQSNIVIESLILTTNIITK